MSKLLKIIVESSCDSEPSKVRKVFERTLDVSDFPLDNVPFEKVLSSLSFLFRDINPIVSFKIFV